MDMSIQRCQSSISSNLHCHTPFTWLQKTENLRKTTDVYLIGTFQELDVRNKLKLSFCQSPSPLNPTVGGRFDNVGFL